MNFGDRFDTVLVDIDGTLIDSNDAHAETWAQALREHGVTIDASRVRPLIGMGGDKLLPAAADIRESSSRGRKVVDRKKALFAERIADLAPTRGARALLEHLRGAGVELVVATSAGDHEVHALLRRARLDDLLPQRATKDSAPESKPDPDIVRAALARSNGRPESTLLVGDTPYDIEAAARAGVATVALRCGGYWSDSDLRGALAIFDDPAALLEHWRSGRVEGPALRTASVAS